MMQLICKHKKLFALLICFALCVNLFLPTVLAEGDGDTQAVTTDAGAASSAEDSEAVDLGGFTLRIFSNSFYQLFNNNALNKYDQVLKERIEKVAEEYNFELEVTQHFGGGSHLSGGILNDVMVNAIQSGFNSMGHFVCVAAPLGIAGTAAGYFQDLSIIDKSTGFDVKDPDCFWQAMTKQLVFEGKHYGVALIAGSMSFQTWNDGTYWAFNKNVLKKNGYSAEMVYKLVRDYEWTFDAATKIMEACYEDENEDGTPEVYGLCSYQAYTKYNLQLDGAQTVRKSNGMYSFDTENANMLSVFNWLKELYVTKKIAAILGSSAVRRNVRDGKTAFAQFSREYITRSEFAGDNLATFQENVGIIPSPVGNNQIKKKAYVNAYDDAEVYVMPSTITGEERNKAATAFAAVAKEINSIEDRVATLQDYGLLYDADMVDMYQNYILNGYSIDPGFVTGTDGNSQQDPMTQMLLRVTSGAKTPEEAIADWSDSINHLLDHWLNRSKEGNYIDGTCGTDSLHQMNWSLNLDDGSFTISGIGRMEDYTTPEECQWYEYMDEIRSINIGGGVQNIGKNAFNGCTAVTSVAFRADVESIGANAFAGCAPEIVYYSGTEAEWAKIDMSDTGFLASAKLCLESIPARVKLGLVNVNATVQEPEDGWLEGENTFSVSASNPCYVAVSNDNGESYERIPATEQQDGYQFTADVAGDDTKVTVGVVGDANGDGLLAENDSKLALQAVTEISDIGSIGEIATDLDDDGTVTAREARLVLQAASGKESLEW
ncbi:MAG: leucine-rich repeat protein [Clostridia bacterium]|nr:leucine-rich repeat protein [Clostridia bacterium]